MSQAKQPKTPDHEDLGRVNHREVAKIQDQRLRIQEGSNIVSKDSKVKIYSRVECHQKGFQCRMEFDQVFSMYGGANMMDKQPREFRYALRNPTKQDSPRSKETNFVFLLDCRVRRELWYKPIASQMKLLRNKLPLPIKSTMQFHDLLMSFGRL